MFSRRWRNLIGLIVFVLPLVAGCELLSHFTRNNQEHTEKEPLTGAPGKHSFRLGQFIFLADFEIRKDHPLFKDLGSLREQVNRELRLPSSQREVWVYLFEDKARYEKFMQTKYRDLPIRRAFFVVQPRRLGGAEDLNVYTYLGDNIHQDLRHELTHALLHCSLKNVPIWLDEGLAEYFELPTSQQGVNVKHVEHMHQMNAKFDLVRLEKLQDVHQMTSVEYRESWAWVHMMLRTTPQAKQALLNYLHDLRNNPNLPALRPRLVNAIPSVSPELAVQSHLGELGRQALRNTNVR
ncbi:MAG: DUF1570 domain-containing protein [Gemmataceae bacterium]|nr:DUF1570 domain-containing protein [Gemmataceae bacterium]